MTYEMLFSSKLRLITEVTHKYDVHLLQHALFMFIAF